MDSDTSELAAIDKECAVLQVLYHLRAHSNKPFLHAVDDHVSCACVAREFTNARAVKAGPHPEQ
jgi:hypothetical protein